MAGILSREHYILFLLLYITSVDVSLSLCTAPDTAHFFLDVLFLQNLV